MAYATSEWNLCQFPKGGSTYLVRDSVDRHTRRSAHSPLLERGNLVETTYYECI